MINLSLIRRFYKNLPPIVLSPVGKVPFSIFCGHNYRKTLLNLKNFDDFSDKELNNFRDNNLINYLNESILYTKFYKDFAKKAHIRKIVSPEQLFEFPILSKEQLDYDLDWFVDKRYKKNSFIVTTGGTTGKQTSLLMSNEAYGIEWAFVSHFLKSQGINIDSRRICLRGSDGINPNKLIGYNHLYKELMISPFRINKDSINSNIQEIEKYKPNWIHGYPSSVTEFARNLLELNIKLKTIKNVLLVSENLYPEQEKIIRSAFNCEISTFYGMTERVIFSPLSNGIFKPNKLYGVTEEINGELVATGFINKATRLIRYKTGDSAVVTKDSHGFVETIDQLLGRWGKEYLLGNNGNKITMTSLNIHSNILKNVAKYQFTQDLIGVCELLIVPLDNFKLGEEMVVAKEFQKKVGQELVITPKLVKDIQLTNRGKHKFIFSRI